MLRGMDKRIKRIEEVRGIDRLDNITDEELEAFITELQELQKKYEVAPDETHEMSPELQQYLHDFNAYGAQSAR